jgi:carbonic anhydrase/acetyltransferase-like protein (isoleucine patch superfamily)
MALYELSGVAPELPPDGSCWIADNAAVIGRVRLKANTCVWFGAVLRGDDDWIELGERSHVLDNCTFHTDYRFPVFQTHDQGIGFPINLKGFGEGFDSLP